MTSGKFPDPELGQYLCPVSRHVLRMLPAFASPRTLERDACEPISPSRHRIAPLGQSLLLCLPSTQQALSTHPGHRGEGEGEGGERADES